MDEPAREPAFHAHAYPEPAGRDATRVGPGGARCEERLHESILPHDVVRDSADPDASLLEFLQGTYEVGATLGGWERASLERS